MLLWRRLRRLVVRVRVVLLLWRRVHLRLVLLLRRHLLLLLLLLLLSTGLCRH